MPKTCSVENCNYDAFCIDKNTRDPYCKNHSYLRTDKKYKRPNARSEKKIEQDKEYSEKRENQLKEHPNCQIRAGKGCTGVATDVHHVNGRVGDNYLDETEFKSSCRWCHGYVHTHPKESREKGWLK